MLQLPQRFHPNSIFGLILIGFLVAILPMAIAFGITAIYVNRIAQQSQVAVMQAVEATQGARLLINQITDMERNVRQYLVLQELELLNVYRETHDAWQQIMGRLTFLHLEAAQRETLLRLIEAEQALFSVFSDPTVSPAGYEQAVEQFAQTRDLARDFLDQSMQWVDREAARLETLAGSTILMLEWMLVVVIPAGLILAGFFATLINRSLRRIVQSIRRLGEEDFATPIVLQGPPRDLRELGERLDWLRRRLAVLDEQKMRFLRHMSHELKTPLTSIREGTELLHDDVLGPLNTQQHEVVVILRDNSVRLQRLIEDMLNFNQALSRNIELRLELLELSTLVREVIDVQRLAWSAKELRIITRLNPLYLTGDREKLKTLIDNILSNAIKFSPAQGRIQIELKGLQGKAQLTIQDNGPGFHPADEKHIFEAFYQGRIEAQGHLKGSGLGLAIAREYAVAHRGRLEIVHGAEPGGFLRLSLPLDTNGSS